MKRRAFLSCILGVSGFAAGCFEDFPEPVLTTDRWRCPKSSVDLLPLFTQDPFPTVVHSADTISTAYSSMPPMSGSCGVEFVVEAVKVAPVLGSENGKEADLFEVGCLTC